MLIVYNSISQADQGPPSGDNSGAVVDMKGKY